MNTRDSLGLLVASLVTVAWTGAAQALPCGIDVFNPCPSDVLTITNGAGVVLTDINGNPATITISENTSESLQNTPVTIVVPAPLGAVVSGSIFLTDGPPIPGSFTPFSDSLRVSTQLTVDPKTGFEETEVLFSLVSGGDKNRRI